VDAEFEQVLMKALARDREQRFQTTREMGDALADYLFRHQLKVTSYDLATLVKQTLEQKTSSQKAAQDQSIIDRLIQEELLRFTSLDDMNDPLTPGASPLSPEDVEGAQPLDAGSFENPADWFADDADLGGNFDSPENREDSAPGWHESGLEQTDGGGGLAQLLEEEAAASGSGETNRTANPHGAGNAPAAASPAGGAGGSQSEAQGQRAPRVPQQQQGASEPQSGGGAWKFILVLVLLAGAGAAAWFGGLIPH
jgi:serine/threonine-protein kinase